MIKTKKFLEGLFWGFALMFLAAPLWLARAESHLTTPGDGKETINIKLENPIGASSFNVLVEKILDIVVTIGVPVVAIFIIYSGFLFVSAQGNKDKLEEAKKAFFWTIIGAAVLLGAWVLANAIGSTIEELRR